MENWYVVTGPLRVAQVQSDQRLWSGDRCNSLHTIVYLQHADYTPPSQKLHKFNSFLYPTCPLYCIQIFLFLFSREVSEKDAKDYADSIHAIFVETSAKNAININEVFIQISESILN